MCINKSVNEKANVVTEVTNGNKWSISCALSRGYM